MSHHYWVGLSHHIPKTSYHKFSLCTKDCACILLNKNTVLSPDLSGKIPTCCTILYVHCVVPWFIWNPTPGILLLFLTVDLFMAHSHRSIASFQSNLRICGNKKEKLLKMKAANSKQVSQYEAKNKRIKESETQSSWTYSWLHLSCSWQCTNNFGAWIMSFMNTMLARSDRILLLCLLTVG